MTLELLTSLEGISPWWWVALAFGLGAVEMLSATFVLIWLALAAVLMALILTIRPDLSGELQVAFFAALSVILVFSGRALMARFGDGGEDSSTLNQRSSQLIGRSATVTGFIGGEGTIEIDGMRWHARWQTGVNSATGDTVTVTHAKGMILDVTPTRN